MIFMKMYKGRTIKPFQEVEVYRNLHTDGFSVRDKATGLVLAHVDTFTITDAKFIVKEAGRLRAIAKRTRNVHAWIEGRWVPHNAPLKEHCHKITYNPFKYDTFVDVDLFLPVRQAPLVQFEKGEAYACILI